MLCAAILRALPILCLVAIVPVHAPAAPRQDRAAILQGRYAQQMQAGKYLEALQTIAALRRLQPNSIAVAEREGMVCFALERWIDAVIAFRRAIKLGSRDLVVRRMLAEALCTVADERLADGDSAGAERLWEEAVQTAPGYPGTPYNRGLAYYRSAGDAERAVAQFTAAIELDRDWPDPLYHRARAYEALGRMEEAVADYKAALEISPDWSECQEALVAAYTGAGDFEGAVQCCGAQIDGADASDDTAVWYGHRAGAYLQLGRYQEALSDFSAAASLAPDLQAARWLAGRAVARFHLGDDKYANEDMLAAANRLVGTELSAADRADALAAIAWRMLEIGWVEEGLEVARQAAATLETEAALRSLAALLVDGARGAEALAEAQKLEQVAVDDALSRVIGGAARALAGDGAAALPLLRDGTTTAQGLSGWSENLAWTWYFAGVGYKAAGDEATAAKATARAYELMPRLQAARDR